MAVRGSWWWPLAIILGVLVFGYLFGLSTYGTGEEDPADDISPPHRSPSTISG